MNKEYYNKVYIPDIVKWGKITMLLGIITCFGPALVISVVYGYMPPVSAIIAGTIAQISVSGAFYIVEPISYFPILDSQRRRRYVVLGSDRLLPDSWNPGNLPDIPFRKYIQHACSVFFCCTGSSRR